MVLIWLKKYVRTVLSQYFYFRIIYVISLILIGIFYFNIIETLPGFRKYNAANPTANYILIFNVL